MMKLTRREWNKLAVGGVVGLPFCFVDGGRRINSKFNGVQIGAQSYSFRDRSLDETIKAMKEVGLGSCELWRGHIEPVRNLNDPKLREEARKWRLSVPLNEFRKVRAKFDRAGIELYAYNLSFRDDFTDEEIERGFEMAAALGVRVMTSSSNVTTARRIDPYAKRYKIRVGMHNHSDIKPNEFATPDDFAKALAGVSEYIAINLDIGHLTAVNFDPVEFLRRHHARIVTLHIKDRKRNQGAFVPFGEGDTPIKEALALMRQNRWRIPANIEYEYEGKDTVEEIKRCFSYCKQAIGA